MSDQEAIMVMLGELKQDFRTHREETSLALAEQRKESKDGIDSITHVLQGNGTPGLKTVVDRLVQSEKSRVFYFRAIIGSILTLLGERVHDVWVTMTSK